MTATSSPDPERQPYESPTITVLGTLADLTRGENTGNGDLDAGFSGDGGNLS